jgi:hypothetical protein
MNAIPQRDLVTGGLFVRASRTGKATTVGLGHLDSMLPLRMMIASCLRVHVLACYSRCRIPTND